MNKDTEQHEVNVLHDIASQVDRLEENLDKVLKNADTSIEPLRRSTFKRFPILFILLTTFGVSVTFFAFERLIAKFPYIYDRPWLILAIGLSSLILTGTLYKKLG